MPSCYFLYLTSESFPPLSEFIGKSEHARNVSFCLAALSRSETRDSDAAALIIVVFYRLEVANLRSGLQSSHFKVSGPVGCVDIEHRDLKNDEVTCWEKKYGGFIIVGHVQLNHDLTVLCYQSSPTNRVTV